MKLEVSDMYRVASNRWARAYTKELYAIAAAFIVGFALVVAAIAIADVGGKEATSTWTHGCTVLATLGGIVLTGMLVSIVVYAEKAISYKREFVQRWVDDENATASQKAMGAVLQEFAQSQDVKKVKKQVSKKQK